MNRKLITSVSLPESDARLWRSSRKEILCFAERFLRNQTRKPFRREVTRTYNRQSGQKFVITTTRFTAVEYDTFHCVAAILRVSVSSLICGLIRMWQDSTGKNTGQLVCNNYRATTLKWDVEAGILLEIIVFGQNAPTGVPP